MTKIHRSCALVSTKMGRVSVPSLTEIGRLGSVGATPSSAPSLSLMLLMVPSADAAIPRPFLVRLSAVVLPFCLYRSSKKAWHQGSFSQLSATRGVGDGRGPTPVPPGPPGPTPQGCIRREGTSEAAPVAGRQAVGGGCRSGWGRLLLVTNAIKAGIWR